LLYRKEVDAANDDEGTKGKKSEIFFCRCFLKCVFDNVNGQEEEEEEKMEAKDVRTD